jgi:hypothetical protein
MLGDAYRGLGRFAEAIDYLNQALMIREEIGDQLGKSRTLNTLGTTYHELGRFQEAIDYLNRPGKSAMMTTFRDLRVITCPVLVTLIGRSVSWTLRNSIGGRPWLSLTTLVTHWRPKSGPAWQLSTRRIEPRFLGVTTIYLSDEPAHE